MSELLHMQVEDWVIKICFGIVGFDYENDT